MQLLLRTMQSRSVYWKRASPTLALELRLQDTICSLVQNATDCNHQQALESSPTRPATCLAQRRPPNAAPCPPRGTTRCTACLPTRLPLSSRSGTKFRPSRVSIGSGEATTSLGVERWPGLAREQIRQPAKSVLGPWISCPSQ